MTTDFNVTVVKPVRGRFDQTRWTDPVTGRMKQRSTKTTSRREADRFAARLEKELRDGTYRDTSSVKWQDFRDRYNAEVMTGLAEKSAVKADTVFNKVESVIKPALLRQIDEGALSRMVTSMRTRGCPSRPSRVTWDT